MGIVILGIEMLKGLNSKKHIGKQILLVPNSVTAIVNSFEINPEGTRTSVRTLVELFFVYVVVILLMSEKPRRVNNMHDSCRKYGLRGSLPPSTTSSF